jgi:hypothetical protein
VLGIYVGDVVRNWDEVHNAGHGRARERVRRLMPFAGLRGATAGSRAPESERLASGTSDEAATPDERLHGGAPGHKVGGGPQLELVELGVSARHGRPRFLLTEHRRRSIQATSTTQLVVNPPVATVRRCCSAGP